MINGVIVRELVWHKDDRGKLAELYRESWYGEIKQCYCTTLRVGVIKDIDTYHCHHKQRDCMILCISGRAKLIIVDMKTKEKMEIEGDEENPKLIIIPKGIAHKLANTGIKEAFIINCIDREYDGTDEFRVPNEEVEKW